ncbi:MAG: prephenate dehydrogenase/arogenate dehydrogenase family protein [Nitrospinaceae bacterium]|nr:prephenate dehydrogenase/arogenate dehydrogenase family protein [Nitrospinaceae bacterium]
MNSFDRVTIIGVGLLGGSLAKVLRKLGLAKSLVGYGRNKANLEEAKSLGIIDEVALDMQSAVQDADLMVLCSPVRAIGQLVREMAPHIKPGCLVTDVGSVKESLVQEVEALIPDGVFFVGAHPIAGGEKSGFRVSTDTLYKGARCIVTPTDKTDASALKRIVELWDTVGMRVSIMDAKEHDFIFGAVSHLPHVLIYALMNTIGSLQSDNHDEITSFSGGGLKDITRIAGGDPVMWRDICLSNKESVLHCLDRFQETLDHLRSGIEQGNGELLTREFETANKHRLNLTGNA